MRDMFVNGSGHYHLLSLAYPVAVHYKGDGGGRGLLWNYSLDSKVGCHAISRGKDSGMALLI